MIEYYSKIDYCCLDSTYLEVKGEECFDTWSDVASYKETCHWSTWTQHSCSMEMMTVSRLCRVAHKPCVIREFYMKLCNNNFVLPLCSDSNNLCWLKNRLKFKIEQYFYQTYLDSNYRQYPTLAELSARIVIVFKCTVVSCLCQL